MKSVKDSLGVFSIDLPTEFDVNFGQSVEGVNYGITASSNNFPGLFLAANFFVNHENSPFDIKKEEEQLKQTGDVIIKYKGERKSTYKSEYWFILKELSDNKNQFYYFVPDFRKNMDYTFLMDVPENTDIKIAVCQMENSILSVR